MSKKKIFLIAVTCLIALIASFGTTQAYLISKHEAVNDFTAGENIIEVHENYDPPKELEPGIPFKKEPYVENTGNLPCFVRMRVDFSDSEAEEFCELVDINEKDWEKNQEDGYYYYNKLLNPEEITESLFKTVKIKDKKENEDSYTLDDMIDFDILIYAESCQHIDHEGNCSSDEYRTVWK